MLALLAKSKTAMITIEISYNDVVTSAIRDTEYIGTKIGAYDKMRATIDDEEQLKHWFVDGLSAVSVVLNRLIASRVKPTLLDDGYTLVLKNVNMESDLLKSAVEMCIEQHIVACWLKLFDVKMAQVYREREIEKLEELKQLAYYREMPR